MADMLFSAKLKRTKGGERGLRSLPEYGLLALRGFRVWGFRVQGLVYGRL